MMVRLLLFFQQFSIWFKVLLGELLNNLISLFFILAVYFSLWHFPQAIDLLLILNQADAFLFEVPLYFFLLISSAFIIWNAPKYFYYHNYKDISLSNLIGFIPNQHYKFQDSPKTTKYSYRVKVHMRMMLPRILALLLLIISALSILNAIALFELVTIYTDILDPTNSLLFSIAFLLLLSEPNFYHVIQNFVNKIPKISVVLFSASIFLLVLIIFLGIINTQTETDLANLFLSNTLLVLLFFTLSFNSYVFLKRIPRKMFYGTILGTGFSFLVSFLVLNFIPTWTTHINPLSVLMLSLVSIFMISFVLILVGKKIKLPLFSIVFVLCLLSARFFTKNSNHYQLHLQDTETVRPDLEQYLYAWIKDREALIEQNADGFPVVLVSAEGGGSRAGLWSFLVHSYLYEKSNGKYYTENLLSLTGASGGSVGNGMFFSVAEHAERKNTNISFLNSAPKKYPELHYKASAIYKENYLSVSILSLLGRDLFKEITNLFSFKNRGQLLEEHWVRTHETYFNNKNRSPILQKEFLSFYDNISDTSGRINSHRIPPLLFVNTTHTQTGKYNIISPVKFAHLRPLTGMDDFIEELQYEYPQKSIGLATAMRINAGFPYITPVSEIRKVSKSGESYSDQYADAGYYDNIGGKVSKGIEEVLKKVIQDSFPKYQEKINIKHIVISNDETRNIVKTQTQFAAPFTTLQNVRYGHTQEITQKLGDRYAITLQPTVIPMTSKSISSIKTQNEVLIRPVLPLGRYLSTVAIRSMEARLQEVSVKLDSILE